MFRYALKRIAYSLLIIAGVMILTFLLFRLAAGDPAATVLGKNPTPSEIEDMRGTRHGQTAVLRALEADGALFLRRIPE